MVSSGRVLSPQFVLVFLENADEPTMRAETPKRREIGSIVIRSTLN
jgi:hypothetical protein